MRFLCLHAQARPMIRRMAVLAGHAITYTRRHCQIVCAITLTATSLFVASCGGEPVTVTGIGVIDSVVSFIEERDGDVEVKVPSVKGSTFDFFVKPIQETVVASGQVFKNFSASAASDQSTALQDAFIPLFSGGVHTEGEIDFVSADFVSTPEKCDELTRNFPLQNFAGLPLWFNQKDDNPGDEYPTDVGKVGEYAFSLLLLFHCHAYREIIQAGETEAAATTTGAKRKVLTGTGDYASDRISDIGIAWDIEKGKLNASLKYDLYACLDAKPDDDELYQNGNTCAPRGDDYRGHKPYQPSFTNRVQQAFHLSEKDDGGKTVELTSTYTLAKNYPDRYCEETITAFQQARFDRQSNSISIYAYATGKVRDSHAGHASCVTGKSKEPNRFNTVKQAEIQQGQANTRVYYTCSAKGHTPDESDTNTAQEHYRMSCYGGDVTNDIDKWTYNDQGNINPADIATDNAHELDDVDQGTVSDRVYNPPEDTNIVLSVPQNLYVTVDDSSISADWSHVGNADGYYIYIGADNRVSPDGNYQNRYEVRRPGKSITIPNLENGTTYFLAVTAYVSASELTAEGESGAAFASATPVVLELNDSGQTRCYDFGNQYSEHPYDLNQDCRYGRDIDHSNDSDGRKGFSFTKLGSDGRPLAIQTAAWYDNGNETLGSKWSCVMDQVTGLVWEVKNQANDRIGDGRRDADDTYTWYNTNDSINGGSEGFPRPSSVWKDWANYDNSCSGYNEGDSSSWCNTQVFVAWVNKAELCGRKDWRLPTREELLGLASYHIHRGRITDNNFLIDSDFFPNTRISERWDDAKMYWTSSTSNQNKDARFLSFVVSFNSGKSILVSRHHNMHVRLVSGAQQPVGEPAVALDSQRVNQYSRNLWPNNRYLMHGDGTVTDKRTGLMWKACSEGQRWGQLGDGSARCFGDSTKDTLKGAFERAENAEYAHHYDWRLPNIKELASLAALDRSDPAINLSIFPGVSSQDSTYWSSSNSPDIYSNNNIVVWSIDFDRGSLKGENYKSVRSTVRVIEDEQRPILLVRGGSQARLDNDNYDPLYSLYAVAGDSSIFVFLISSLRETAHAYYFTIQDTLTGVERGKWVLSTSKITTFNGLENGTTYRIGLKIYSGTGQLIPINKYVEATPSGDYVHPAIPTNLMLFPQDGKILVAWERVADVIGYRIYYNDEHFDFTDGREEGVEMLQVNQSSSPTSSATIPNLTNETAYFVAITSFNNDEESFLSDRLSATPIPPPPPHKPTNIITSATSNAIDITWDAISNDNISGYNIYYRAGEDFDSQTEDGVVPARRITSGGVTNAAITGLTPGVTYYLRISAYNGGGESELSDKGISATPRLVAPQGFEIIEVGNRSIKVEWENVPGASFYTLYYNDSPFTNISEAKSLHFDRPGLYETEIIGLNNFTTYYLRISSGYSGSMSDLSTQLEATPKLPAPKGFSAQVGYDNLINVSWNAVENAYGYSVFYKAGYFSSSTDNNVNEHNSNNTTNATITNNVSIGTEYYLRVATRDNQGNHGPLSYPVTVTPGFALRTWPGHEKVYLRWNAVSGADSYHVYHHINNNISINTYTAITSVTGVNAEITDLINGNVYYFFVTALIRSEESSPSRVVSATPLVATSLNDTGVTWGGSSPDGNENSCNGVDKYLAQALSHQDCHQGRDVEHYVASDGRAGFSFTKLDANGIDLPVTAPNWDCVLDNVTGLVWEVKVSKNNESGESMHDADDKFQWYNSDDDANGGLQGYAKSSDFNEDYEDDYCYGYTVNNPSTYCNSEAFIQRVNSKQLCGRSNWRLPSTGELLGIVNLEGAQPLIDTDFFPSTHRDNYMTSTRLLKYSDSYIVINFDNGLNYFSNVGRNLGHVRLVSGEQGQAGVTATAVGEDQRVDVQTINYWPDSRYQVLGDGTVVDAYTGLMWKQCAQGHIWTGLTCAGEVTFMDWQAALATASNEEFADYTDWRLPNIKELYSLGAKDRYYPGINLSIFFNIQEQAIFLSSTPSFAGYGEDVFGVAVESNPYMELDRNQSEFLVRLVRDANSRQ